MSPAPPPDAPPPHPQTGGTTVKTAVKIVLIAAAAVTCVTRFISFKYESSLSPAALRALFLAAAGWVILEKKGKNGT